MLAVGRFSVISIWRSNKGNRDVSFRTGAKRSVRNLVSSDTARSIVGRVSPRILLLPFQAILLAVLYYLDFSHFVLYEHSGSK